MRCADMAPLVTGDWYLTPEEAQDLLACEFSIHYPSDGQGSPQATRWQGHRCVDWCACALGSGLRHIWLDGSWRSDHLLLKMTNCAKPVDLPDVVGAQDCSPPEHEQLEAWADRIARTRKHECVLNVVPRCQTDQCWRNFNCKLESVLTRAGGRKKTCQIPSKGSVFTFQWRGVSFFRISIFCCLFSDSAFAAFLLLLLFCFCCFFAFVAFLLFAFPFFCSLLLLQFSALAAVLLSLVAFAFPFVCFVDLFAFVYAYLSKQASKQARAAHLWIWCAAAGALRPPPTPPRHEICTSSPTPTPAPATKSIV